MTVAVGCLNFFGFELNGQVTQRVLDEQLPFEAQPKYRQKKTRPVQMTDNLTDRLCQQKLTTRKIYLKWPMD